MLRKRNTFVRKSLRLRWTLKFKTVCLGYGSIRREGGLMKVWDNDYGPGSPSTRTENFICYGFGTRVKKGVG